MRSYLRWVLRYRWLIIVLTAMVTVLAISQARNLRVIIDPNTILPQSHPYVATTLLVEKIFGSKYIAVIGVTPKNGDIYQPAVLGKVQRITAALLQTELVVKENMLSLSARRAKDIIGTADGMEVKPLMATVPQTPEQLAQLKLALHRNPAYMNSIVSQDETTATVIAELRDVPGGFRGMMEAINRIVDKERDASVDIVLGGMPNILAQIEIYSERMAILLPIAILLVGLILFEAFRTFQGMILPLITAMLAVAWGVGVMGAAGVPMDAFNATTPILILAVSAGHAVQLLKRYYEEYYRILDGGAITPREANRRAVIESVAKSGPVMMVAGMVAALGFFSLVVFEITTVRTFGIFTGMGIVAALVLEMTFIPALRSLLPAPGAKEREHNGYGNSAASDNKTCCHARFPHPNPPPEGEGANESLREFHVKQRARIWDRIAATIAHATLHRRGKVYAGALALAAIGLMGMSQVVTNNSTKTYFAPDLPFQLDDRFLNEHMGGTNTLVLLIDGKREDAIKDPKVLQAMDDIQRFLDQQPYVGKSVSLADFIKRINQAMHGDDPAYYRIPEDANLISQYLLLYSMSGEPGDFDSYVDNDYRMANMTAFLKTDSSAYIEQLLPKLKSFAAERLGARATLSIGGNVPQATALNEEMVRGKILNIAQIGAVVFVISSLVFGSFKAGLMVLLPLLMAVIANFGVMGFSGMYLNIANSLSSAMAVGIGADYAIYLIYRLREELANGMGESDAVRLVLNTAGKACLFVAIAISAGYGVLLFSFGFYMHIWLATLIATAMMVSVFAALFLIPSLVLTFRPDFVFKGVPK
ncbi:MAG: MMPL family transporter [Gallionella sp.]